MYFLYVFLRFSVYFFLIKSLPPWFYAKQSYIQLNPKLFMFFILQIFRMHIIFFQNPHKLRYFTE